MKKPMTEMEIETVLKRLLPRYVVIKTCKVEKEDNIEDGVRYDRNLCLICHEVGFENDALALAQPLKAGILNQELHRIINDFGFYVFKHCRDRLFIPFLDVVENHETVQ